MALQFQAGKYWGKVTAQALGKTKNDNPQFVVTADILGAIDPSNPDGELLKCPQGTRTIYMVITDKTVDYVRADVDVLIEKSGNQIDFTSWGQLDPSHQRHVSFIDTEVPLFCNHEDYEGTAREKWRIDRGGGKVEVEPLEPAEMRKLDAMFGKSLAKKSKRTTAAMDAQAPLEQPPSRRKSNGKSNDDPNAALQEAAAEARDDGIPF